jgi:hypothetical protein
MEPIADVAAVRPILASLLAKGLVVALTPEGRGQVVTHALYTASEMEQLRVEYRNYDPEAASRDDDGPSLSRVPAPSRPVGAGTADAAAGERLREEMHSLRRELEEVREETRSLRRDLDELRTLLS